MPLTVVHPGRGSSPAALSCWITLALIALGALRVSCQLPDDIQRELNQNLAEQARIQQQQQHQRQLQQSRAAGHQQPQAAAQQQAAGQPAHDPNNYSYQQVSPPIQYSYYQPFGDAAPQPQQPQQQPQQQQAATPANFDLNNLNFDLPQPQAQVSSSSPPVSNGQTHLTPSFTGAGGLPVMKPVAASLPVGQPPLAPQARVQQGPPLTEADFKDITGGENYGAPGGNDFGLGDASSNSAGNGRSGDNTDAQLREFGLPASMAGGGANSNGQRRSSAAPIESSAQNMNIPDFGAFNPIGATRQRSAGGSGDPAAGFGDFGNLGGMGGGPTGGAGGSSPRQGAGGEFDFASQPSSNQGTDQATATLNGGAPGSLQSLLGSGFPGLGGDNSRNGGQNSNANTGGGLDGFASGGNDPQSQPQRVGDGSMDIADLGDKSDQFSGADLGGFEQPNPSQDQDFNYAAASEQQPSSVPYADGNPQLVGTILAVTQPQSLTQTRYNALPDKGTYQDYPAYQADGGQTSGVTEVVDATPRARPAGPGRYGAPAPEALAPEYAQGRSSKAFDYGLAPWQGRRYA